MVKLEKQWKNGVKKMRNISKHKMKNVGNLIREEKKRMKLIVYLSQRTRP